MKDKLANTRKHLRAQIDTASRLGSEWVYILTSEAENCLELVEAEDTIMMEPVPAEIEGDGHVIWWYVCGECHSSIDPNHKYCHECGRKIRW